MDKPSSEEKALERVRNALQAQIAGIAKRSRAMRMDPDLSPIWDGEDFQALPPAAQAEVRAWAEKEGYAKPEPELAIAKDDPRTETVRKQIAGIAKRSRAMRKEPDLSPILDGEDFNALSPELQASVREWVAEQGYGTAQAPSATPPASRDGSAFGGESAPNRQDAAERPASPERKEKEERREGPKRKFIGYRVVPEAEGGFSIEEDYEEKNDETGRYEQKTVKTTIAIPRNLVERIENDADAANTVAGYCDQLRGELDGSGVKIFFDPQKGDPEKLFPKWKYAFNKEDRAVEPIKIDEIPPEIIALVKDDIAKGKKQYFNTPAWKKWFGPQMQRKREEIIAAELAKRYPDPAPVPATEARTEPSRTETAPAAGSGREQRTQDAVAEAAAPEAVEETASVTPELAAGIDMLVDKFTPLFKLPKETDKLIDYITLFSKGIFEYQVVRSGAKKIMLPAETLRDAIKASILEKFSGDRAVIDEVRRLMPDRRSVPPPPPAEALAEAADDVTKLGSEDIESFEPAEKQETPVDAAYTALRRDLDRLASPKDIEEFSFSLRELKKSGLETVATAADRLLGDIEFGRAGEFSEDRIEGLSRTDAEREFFDRHPALDKRNVQRLEDGRVIAHIDRLRPTEALRRTLGRTVDDALTLRGIDGGPKLIAWLSEYVMGIVTGGNPNEDLIARFTKDLAAYDPQAEELTIKNIDKLGGVIANLAKKIEEEKK